MRPATTSAATIAMPPDVLAASVGDWVERAGPLVFLLLAVIVLALRRRERGRGPDDEDEDA